MEWIWIGFCLAAGAALFVIFIRLWRLWLLLIAGLIAGGSVALVTVAYNFPPWLIALAAIYTVYFVWSALWSWMTAE